MTPPNILWICTDQQRYDAVGYAGNPHLRTPHIDALARRGVSFPLAFCQSPACTPSRASFLTGRYPRTTTCRQNGQTLPPTERQVTKLLADAGYYCGLAGKQHLSSCANGRVEPRGEDGYEVFHWSHHPQPDWPENAYTRWLAAHGQQWERLLGEPLSPYVQRGVPARWHQTSWCAEMAIQFIRQPHHGPWLFTFNCFDPHHPFDPPTEYLDRHQPQTLPLPVGWRRAAPAPTRYQLRDREWAHDEPGYFHTGAMTDDDVRLVIAAYYAMVELIDDAVGRMVEALEETGQLQNTLVIFMSDHGELLGDHGLFLKGPHFYEGAVRVPLTLHWPAGLPAGRQVDQLVELVDLAPTLLEAAGLARPTRMQGRSLLPLAAGPEAQAHASARDHVYCEYYNAWTHPHAYGTMFRTRDAKLVVYHGIDEGELYDLRADPGELENLWGRPQAARLQQSLMKAAFDASVFTMDPEPPRLGPF